MLPADGGGGSGIPPGDPGALRAAAATLTATAGAYQSAAGSVRAQAGSLAGLGWKGLGADGFEAAAQRYAGRLSTVQQCLDQLSTAMSTYAAALEAAQAQARSALRAARTAESDSAAAQARVDNRTPPPAGATTAEVQSFQTTQTQTTTAINDQLQAALSRSGALQAQALAQAQAAAGRATAAVQSATGTLSSLVMAPPSVLKRLGDINDKAGWVLDAWGLYGAAVTSDKTFAWLGARNTYVADLGEETETFWNWYGREGSYFDWAHKAATLDGSRSALRSATQDMEEAIAPEGSDWSVLGTLGKVGLGAGMASDAITILNPTPSWGPDGLLGGNTDRAMAGVNLAASGLALGDTMGLGMASAALAIPGVDVIVGVALVGTAAYFAGEFVYQHWDDITHFAGNVVSGAHHVVDDVGHAISHAFSWL